jgi:hypothetical protein
MSIESSRGILIAILIVCGANLLVGVLQTGLLLRQPATVAASPAAGDPFAGRFDSAAMATIARRVVEPYNRDDSDAIYQAFDDIAKVNLTRDEFEKQLKPMYELIGKIDTVAYESARKTQDQGGLNTYEVKYAVKLSGGRFKAGEMILHVFDRGSDLGIYGFFVTGNMQ